MKLVRVRVTNMVIKQKLPLSTWWPTHSLVRTSVRSEFKREASTFHISAPSAERSHDFLTVWTDEALGFNILGASQTKGIYPRCKAKSLPRTAEKVSVGRVRRLVNVSIPGPGPLPPPHESISLAFLTIPLPSLTTSYFPDIHPKCHLWVIKDPSSKIPNSVRCNNGTQESGYRDRKSPFRCILRSSPSYETICRLDVKAQYFQSLRGKSPFTQLIFPMRDKNRQGSRFIKKSPPLKLGASFCGNGNEDPKVEHKTQPMSDPTKRQGNIIIPEVKATNNFTIPRVIHDFRRRLTTKF